MHQSESVKELNKVSFESLTSYGSVNIASSSSTSTPTKKLNKRKTFIASAINKLLPKNFKPLTNMQQSSSSTSTDNKKIKKNIVTSLSNNNNNNDNDDNVDINVDTNSKKVSSAKSLLKRSKTSNFVKKFQSLKKPKITINKKDNKNLTNKMMDDEKNSNSKLTTSGNSSKRDTPEGGDFLLSADEKIISDTKIITSKVNNKNNNNNNNKKLEREGTIITEILVEDIENMASNIQLQNEEKFLSTEEDKPIIGVTNKLKSVDDQISHKLNVTNLKMENINKLIQSEPSTSEHKKESIKSRLIKHMNVTDSDNDKTPKIDPPSIPTKSATSPSLSTLSSSSVIIKDKDKIQSVDDVKKDLIEKKTSLTSVDQLASDKVVIDVSKGAIKKELEKHKLKKQQSRDEFFEGLLKTSGTSKSTEILSSTDINKNSPETTNQSYKLGNNLSNPNLSGFKSVENISEKKEEIKFDIGTAVRPPNAFVDPQILQDFDAKIFTSISPTPSSTSSTPTSDLSRRRITFVAQPTIYSSDEQEQILNEQNNNNSKDEQTSSTISMISDNNSIDSELTFDVTKMSPPHGDLIAEPMPNMTSSSSSPEKREYLYKILVIGELGTGKTSFIRRYVHNFFSQNYRATIGVDFALKVLNWDQKSIIRLQLWDIAGQERFGNMTRVYYKEAAGAFIVFDVTRSATFDAVIKWKQDLDSKVQLPDGSPIPCILLANKCDQPKQGAANNTNKLDEYVRENGFAGWYETSAKDNINIEDAAKALVNKILSNDKLINAGVLIDNEKIALDGQNEQPQKKNCAC